MKKVTLSLIAAATLTLVACGGAKQENTNTEAAELANEVSVETPVTEEVVATEEVVETADSTVATEEVVEATDSTVVVEETTTEEAPVAEEAHNHEGHEAH